MMSSGSALSIHQYLGFGGARIGVIFLNCKKGTLGQQEVELHFQLLAGRLVTSIFMGDQNLLPLNFNSWGSRVQGDFVAVQTSKNEYINKLRWWKPSISNFK